MPKNKSSAKPLVSLCTPTFNRRPFIPSMITCFEQQTYPHALIEWIIIDDGTDKIEDLVKHIPQVKYYKYEKKMPLGEKRNLMHSKSKGDIIVYMDDDDYYPPERINHAVETLMSSSALCAGSSEIYIYFKHIKEMYQFGPYGPNHATAGTFAFKRELLKDHSYENTAALAEEKHFLKNYSVPFVQLDPMKTILVFSHIHNTFDKKKLLENPHPQYVRKSDKTVNMFIKNKNLKKFYMNTLEDKLKDYTPGLPTMKPDVLKQIIEIEESRRKHAENMAKNQQKIIINDGEKSRELTTEEVIHTLQQQQVHIKQLTELLQGKDIEIEMLQEALKNETQKEEQIKQLTKLLQDKDSEIEIFQDALKNETKKETKNEINMSLIIKEKKETENKTENKTEKVINIFDEINQEN